MDKRWKIASIIGLGWFAALPLVLSIGYALLYSLGVIGALNKGFTLLHWQKLFTESAVFGSFAFSAYIAVVTIVVAVALSLTIALQYHRHLQRGFFSSVIFLPMAFPALVSAFFFFHALSKSGLLSRLAYKAGIVNSIEAFPDLVNDQWGIGIIAAHLFICFPFFVMLFVNRIKTERVGAYLSLAKSLGATHWQALKKVAIPLLIKKTLPNILLYFIFMFGSYEIPLLLGRSSPEMVSVLAVRKLQKFNLYHIPQGYAVAVLYTVFTLGLLIIILRSQKLDYDL